MVRKSFAFYIIGLIVLVTALISLTYYYAGVRYQQSILALYETSKDKDIRFVIHSLIINEIAKLSALSKSLREREDLVVDIAVSSATDRHIGGLKTVMDSLVRDLGLGICLVTDKTGRIIYNPRSPEMRGQVARAVNLQALRGGANLLEVVELRDGWAIRAVVPAFVGREFVGAIAIGTWIDDAFAGGFARATDVEVTICTPERIVASSLSPEMRAGHMDFGAVRRSIAERDKIRREDAGANTVEYYKPLELLGKEFVLMEEFDTDEFAALNDSLRRRHIGIFTTFTVSALLLASILTLKLVSPLKRLKAEAEKTVRDITGREITAHGGNEVTSLVSSFNVMVDTVRGHLAERNKMELSLRQAKQDWENTFNSITDIITIQDNDYNIVAANKAAEKFLRLPDLSGTKAKCYFYYHGRNAPPKNCLSCECASARTAAISDFYEPHLGMHVEIRAIPRLDASGRQSGIIHIVRDITVRKKLEEELIRQALYDPLTGLPNRVLFMDRLENLFNHRARHEDLLFSVLFMDLDHFKKVNDSLGHIFGDELLIGVAQRLKECVRPGDTVSRFGGDEFVILLDELKGPEDSTDIAGRILDDLKRPFHIRGHEVYTSASIGICVISSGYRNPEEFLRDADTALYNAKGRGRARLSMFDPDMHETAVESLKLENDMRKALDRGEFVVHYQPIVNLEDGSIAGFEALLRWQHPAHGLVMPEAFVPLAEESGLISRIGEWVLRESCTRMKTWQKIYSHNPALSLSVNLSTRQFTSELPSLLERVIKETGINPKTLNIEITESVLMKDADTAMEVISAVKALDINVYLDDFGTGFSSLNYIYKFPVDAVKIDRSFIRDLCNDREAQEIVRAIASLAQNLGIVIIVEGIEDHSQLELVRSLKCKLTQGYLFSEPMDFRMVEKYLLDSGR